MINVDFGKAFNEALELFKQNFLLMLLVVVVGAVTTSMSCGILGGAMLIGQAGIALRLVDKDETKPQIGDLFSAKMVSFIVPGLIALIVAGALSALTCGIGGLLMFPVANIAFFYIADKGDTSAFGAFSEVCGKVLKTQGGIAFLMVTLLAMIIAGLGGVVCGLGILVTAPLSTLILASLYRQVYPKA